VVVFIVLASLDNVAIGLTPPLYSPIGDDLGVPEAAVSLVTAVTFLVTAVAAVGWAYVGDRSNRKPLLMVGTLLWAAGTGATALAGGYAAFFAAQLLGSVGLGAVASVGFSVVSDLVSPGRRGLAMSFWGLSQGVGTLAGTFTGGVLGHDDWRRPFVVLTGVGLAATVACQGYEHRITLADLPGIAARRTNVWLVLQGLTAQMAFGSLVWLPRLFQAKAEHQGYPQETAIVVGSVFAVLFQLGAALSVIGGLVGDRLQRRTPRGRALVAAVGILAAVPLYVGLFFAPFTVHVPLDAGTGDIVAAVLRSAVTEPTVAACLLVALVALALTSANSPNWFALLADVNPPEHRGTVYSAGNLANGLGRAAGNGLTGPVIRALAAPFPPPVNYALGMALFQIFFIPTGLMYYLASRTSPGDIESVRGLLDARAAAAARERAHDEPVLG